MEENYKQKQLQQFSLSSNIDDQVKDEEEDASLALLIEELKHKAEDHHSHPPPYFATNLPNNAMIHSTNNINYKEQVILDDFQGINNGNNNGNVGFEDCFGGLDTLPEVSGFKFPLFDYFPGNNGTT
uniref:Uncharacterized protein n=1 Tax=Cucumis melo TaxID=3656 RepID=A0A9I9CRD9_CUCME